MQTFKQFTENFGTPVTDHFYHLERSLASMKMEVETLLQRQPNQPNIQNLKTLVEEATRRFEQIENQLRHVLYK